MNCIECEIQTENPQFCSLSCSAKTNNRLHPKRKKAIRKCVKCGIGYTRHWSSHRKTCDKCKRPSSGPWKLKTLGDVRNLPSQVDARRHWKHSVVRAQARKKFLSPNDKCFRCGYDKHVEIAHVRSLASLPDNTLINEANALSNILKLCPNCHWEFDHSL